MPDRATVPLSDDPVIELRVGDVAVTVHPDAGARIGQITVRGEPLLIDVPESGRRDRTSWGSFVMVPWAGRIRGGRFRFDGVDHRLPIDHHDGSGAARAHAIHGLAVDRPWATRAASGGIGSFAIELDWGFGGTAAQTIVVDSDHVELSLIVASTGASFPAEIGWHPWFRRPFDIEFEPTAMYERDDFGLPTGELVDPSPGPWDDCFLTDGPVRLRYDRTVAPTVTISSDCDHWVVYSEPDHAICVEPQSGPPDAFNLAPAVAPHVVTPTAPLARSMTISW